MKRHASMSQTVEGDHPHPHTLQATIPDRLPAPLVRRLSAIDPARATRAIGAEWGMIVAAVLVSAWGFAENPLVYGLAVMFIGARQHALAIIGHDAVHFRLFGNRALNDALGNLLVAWPIFMDVPTFRRFHGSHHRHLGTEEDENRRLWNTHNAAGELTREWRFPKSAGGLVAVLAGRGAFLTGIWWIVRSLAGMVLFRISWAPVAVRVAYYATILGIVSMLGGWSMVLWYWLTPFCTWYIVIHYVRLICEHSAIPSDEGAYGQTRTTLAGPLERLFVLPRNVHFHIEHHWYPSVPWYNLPALHHALMAQPGFRDRAVVTPSMMASLRQCVRS
ncbi:MAG: fatty acid desaturase family protein [Myxococcota bacterium]